MLDRSDSEETSVGNLHKPETTYGGRSRKRTIVDYILHLIGQHDKPLSDKIQFSSDGLSGVYSTPG
jgi:hypothetical protein